MKLKMFSVYDSKALCYGVPFFMANVGTAVRAFGDLACDHQSMVNKHPSDYVLYEIGEFNDGDGTIISIQPFVNLGLGSDFIPVSPSGKVTRSVDPEVLKVVSGSSNGSMEVLS